MPLSTPKKIAHHVIYLLKHAVGGSQHYRWMDACKLVPEWRFAGNSLSKRCIDLLKNSHNPENSPPGGTIDIKNPLVSLIQSAYPKKKVFLLNLLKNSPKENPG